MENKIEVKEEPKEKIDIIKGKLAVLQDQAEKFIVKNNDDLILIDNINERIDTEIQETHELLDDICKKAFETHKTATSKRKGLLDPLEAVKSLLKGKADVYQLAQIAIQDKIDSDNEIKRLAEEKKEKDKIQKKIETATVKGNLEKVEELEEQKEMVFVAPIVQSNVQQTVITQSGSKVKRKADYDLIIEDEKLILTAIINGFLPFTSIKIGKTELNNIKSHIKGMKLESRLKEFGLKKDPKIIQRNYKAKN